MFLLNCFNLFPSILDYTRITRLSKSCIDNIYTNCELYKSEILSTHISDHTAQKLSFSVHNTTIKSGITRRVFNNQNKALFKNILSEQNWFDVYSCAENDVNGQWNSFMQTILPIFNECFPLKSLKNNPNKKLSYYKSPELDDCKNQLDLMLVLSRSDSKYKDAYNMVKRRYNKLLIESRKQAYSNKIQNSDNKSKCVWQIIDTIKGKANKSKDILIEGDPHILSNEFNDYLLGAAPDLLKDFKNVHFETAINNNEQTMFVAPVSKGD